MELLLWRTAKLLTSLLLQAPRPRTAVENRAARRRRRVQVKRAKQTYYSANFLPSLQENAVESGSRKWMRGTIARGMVDFQRTEGDDRRNGEARPMSQRAILLFFSCVLLAISPAPKTFAEVSKKEVREYQKTVANLVRGKRQDALYRLVKEIAEKDSPRLATLLLDVGTALESERIYNRAVEGIARLKNPEAIQALIKALDSRRTPTARRVLVLDGFAKRTDDEEAFHAAVEHLKSSSVQMQLAVIGVMRSHRRKEAVPLLIDVLDRFSKVRERIWYEVRVALVDLTGRDFEEVEDWRKFWKTAKETLDPKKIDEERRGKKGKKKGKKKKDGKTSGTSIVLKKRPDAIEFFGAEVFSRNLTFVIDISGSMVLYDPSDEYEGDDEERDRQRLVRAKVQLTSALKKLKPSTRFNIISFSHTITRWKKQLVPAKPKHVAAAVKFVRSLEPAGGTHTDEAIKAAFEDFSVDTIVLLTDGAPAKVVNGRQRPGNPMGLMKRILKYVKNVNAGRRVVIETFGFTGHGESPSSHPQTPAGGDPSVFVKFLKRLASITGGSFHAIK